jgi:glyoxylate reductase
MRADALVAAELRDLIPEQALRNLVVRWLPAEAPTPSGDFAAIVPLLSRTIGRAELDGLPRLRIVANCAVGVDNIDLAATEQSGVIVTNTPDVLTEATADLTWALILATARRLKEGQQLLTAGRWRGWHPTLLLGTELRGRVLGLVGAGRIGQAVARRGVGFGMRILYTARSPKPDLERETGAMWMDLRSLLERSDVVSLHLPSTDQTSGVLNRERLALMKEGALLINTARGDLVHEPALLEALESGRLGGAGLDVFPEEPRVHPVLVAHPRVVVLPHLGSATTDTRRAMAALALRNVRAVLAGEPPVTPVCR